MRRSRLPLLVLVLVGTACTPPACAPPTAGPPAAAPPAAAPPPTTGLPFAMPSPATLDAAGPDVFAHYFPPYPISIDNRPEASDYYTTQYLTADGEGGKHRVYGGMIRQRPFARAVIAGPSWQLEDMKSEVRRASDAGLDGFTVDLVSISGHNWDRARLLLDAAASVDPNFDIIPMPDGNTGVTNDPVALANAIASIAGHPSVRRLDDGRLVVAPFLPERAGAAWWANWMVLMRDRGVEVALVPTMVDFRHIDAFDDISYGASAWGGRSTATVGGLAGMADAVHARGLLWMQPVALQDARPGTGIYDEANNTELFRTMWAAAQGRADWVQIVTWNDYSEATEISPSSNTGWSPLDLTAYYVATFKTGVAPAILRDHVYVSHRAQAVAAAPTGGQTSMMLLRGDSSPARDGVEVLTFLRAAADVTVNVGAQTHQYRAPAGAHAQVVPLATGAISIRVVGADGVTTTVTSPYPVVDRPVVQDLQYRFASSYRQGSG